MANRTVAVLGLVVAIVVVLAVALVIGIGIANSRIESELEASVDASIRQAGLEEVVDYRSIDVNAARGMATMNDVSFVDPMSGAEIDVGVFSVRVPPREALALAQNSATAVVTKMDVSVTELGFTQPGSGVPVRVGSIDLAAEGSFSAALMGVPPAQMLANVSSLELEIEEISMAPSADMIAQAQMGFGAMPWMEDPENWRIESLGFAAITEGASLVVESMDFSSPLAELSGSGTLQPGPDGTLAPTTMEISVDEIEASMRAAVSQMAAAMGASLPEEGPFVFSFAMGADGVPRITVE